MKSVSRHYHFISCWVTFGGLPPQILTQRKNILVISGQKLYNGKKLHKLIFKKWILLHIALANIKRRQETILASEKEDCHC